MAVIPQTRRPRRPIIERVTDDPCEPTLVSPNTRRSAPENPYSAGAPTRDDGSAQELQRQNTVLCTQLETSLDAVLLVDENARIISYNRRFVEMMRKFKQR